MIATTRECTFEEDFKLPCCRWLASSRTVLPQLFIHLQTTEFDAYKPSIRTRIVSYLSQMLQQLRKSKMI
jgi:hypothetical protein